MRLSELTGATADALKSAGAVLLDLMTPTVRLGVTGLARSGKTVFITALVRNLVAGGRLPFFAAMAEGRIARAYLEPQPDDSVPRFAYEEHLADLARDPPQWPESTRRISQLRVTIEYTPATALRRALATGRLHVDIVDYPGEWLIDLPLLETRFVLAVMGPLPLISMFSVSTPRTTETSLIRLTGPPFRAGASAT